MHQKLVSYQALQMKRSVSRPRSSAREVLRRKPRAPSESGVLVYHAVPANVDLKVKGATMKKVSTRRCAGIHCGLNGKELLSD